MRARAQETGIQLALMQGNLSGASDESLPGGAQRDLIEPALRDGVVARVSNAVDVEPLSVAADPFTDVSDGFAFATDACVIWPCKNAIGKNCL